MKVILNVDVKGQGKRANSRKCPTVMPATISCRASFATEATADNLNAFRLKEKAKAAQIAREKAGGGGKRQKAQRHSGEIAAKAGSNSKLFGSVTSKEISDALHEQFDLTIEKQKIVQAEAIKSFGAYEVKCKLGYEVTGTIHVLVIEKERNKPRAGGRDPSWRAAGQTQPPHSAPAEQAVIGAMLVDPRHPGRDRKGQSDEVHIQASRDIFDTIFAMFSYGQSVDAVTVLEQMKVAGVAGHDAAVPHWRVMQVTPTAANVLKCGAASCAIRHCCAICTRRTMRSTPHDL